MSIYSVIPHRLISFVRAYFLRVSILVLFLVIVWPDRYASHYPFISPDDIYDELVKKTTANVSKATAGKLNCEYGDIIAENRYMYREPYISELLDGNDIHVGGEYMPTECAPLFSTAIIVVYRNRPEQLKAFLTYIHNYLRKQQIHYRIFIVEQYDQKPFNRAMLFNIGSLYATQYGFPCMILHDVDLMPLRLGNLYACTRCPRHMCAGLDKFRFNLLYQGLFGGVISVETPTFQFVNGMSNMFHGWGGEDDDFYGRLRAKNIDICRFEPTYSHYTMLKHDTETPNEFRYAFLWNGTQRYHSDGLNSLVYEEREVRLHKLFTHILAVT